MARKITLFKNLPKPSVEVVVTDEPRIVYLCSGCGMPWRDRQVCCPERKRIANPVVEDVKAQQLTRYYVTQPCGINGQFLSPGQHVFLDSENHSVKSAIYNGLLQSLAVLPSSDPF